MNFSLIDAKQERCLGIQSTKGKENKTRTNNNNNTYKLLQTKLKALERSLERQHKEQGISSSLMGYFKGPHGGWRP